MDFDRVRKELQESALREFPNPERVGCPAPETLAGMSRRIIQMTQDQLHHVTHLDVTSYGSAKAGLADVLGSAIQPCLSLHSQTQVQEET